MFFSSPFVVFSALFRSFSLFIDLQSANSRVCFYLSLSIIFPHDPPLRTKEREKEKVRKREREKKLKLANKPKKNKNLDQKAVGRKSSGTRESGIRGIKQSKMRERETNRGREKAF